MEPVSESDKHLQWKLPKEWEWVRLGQAFHVQSQGVDPSKALDEQFVLYSMPAYDSSKEPELRYGHEIGSTKLQVQTGSILLSKLNPRIPRVWLVRDNLEQRKLASTDFLCLVGRMKFEHEPYFGASFATLLLLSEVFRRQVTHSVQGATGSRQRLRRETILEAWLPRPPLEVQNHLVRRVEELLAEVKEARMRLQRMRRDVSQLLPSAIDQILSQRQYDLNYVPLREVSEAFNGRASGQGESPVRVFKTKHVYPHRLRLDRPSYMKPDQVDKLPENRFLRPGDVLMANIAEGTLGRVSYVDEIEENWTTDTQIMILRSRSEQGELVGKWLYYFLWSEAGQREILARRSGIAFADKRGQTHIYPKNVLDLPIPLPTSHEKSSVECQREIVNRLDAFQFETDQMQTVLNEKMQLLDELERSLLNQAFRGQL